MRVFLLVALYVQFEKSYESFNPNAATIYRITLETDLNNERVFLSAENYPEVAHVIQELPEVEDVTQLYNLGHKNNVIITNEDANPPIYSFQATKISLCRLIVPERIAIPVSSLSNRHHDRWDLLLRRMPLAKR